MEKKQEKEITKYLLKKKLPTTFNSTKANFIAVAEKYSLNKKKKLLRDNKIVVTKNMEAEIYKSLHQHSRRTTTWERIKAR